MNTIAPLVLNVSSLSLQVIRTIIKSPMGSKFGKILPGHVAFSFWENPHRLIVVTILVGLPLGRFSLFLQVTRTTAKA